MKTQRSVLRFDGTSDCFVQVAKRPEHRVARDLTLEAWVWVDEHGPEWTGIVSKVWHTDDTQGGYGLLLDGDGGFLLGLKPTGAPIKYRTSGSDTLPVGEWHHLAGTYDGKAVTLYLDGEVQASYEEAAAAIAYTPENELYIGTNRDDDETRPFKGKIAEVRVWDRARTQAELRRDMQARLRGDEPNLVAYFPIDEGDGDRTDDRSAGRAVGEIHRAAWERVEGPLPGEPAVVEPAGGGAPRGRLPAAFDTSAVLAAALERLNRQSLTELLQQIVAEVDEHCRTVDGRVGEEIAKLRRELMLLIEGLRRTTDEHGVSILELQRQLLALQRLVQELDGGLDARVTNIVDNRIDLRLPDILKTINLNLQSTIEGMIDRSIQKVDLGDVLTRIDQLQAKLVIIKQSAEELDAGELGQVEALLRKLLATIDLGDVIKNVRIHVNGAGFGLQELLELLVTADRVRAIDFTYDRRDLTGAVFVLLDGTRVQFVARRVEDADGARLTYQFEALSWKGLPASFKLEFRRNRERWSMCKKTVTLDSYDAVHQSNVVFDLAAG
jgi:hypothetical protein